MGLLLTGRGLTLHCVGTGLAHLSAAVLWDHTGVSDNPKIPHHTIVASHNLRAAGHNDGGPCQLPDDAALVPKAEHLSSLAGPHPGIQAPAPSTDHGAGWVSPAAGAEASGFATDPSSLAKHLWDALLGHGAEDSLGVDPSTSGAESAGLGAVSPSPPAQGAVATHSPIGHHPAVIRDVVATADHSCNRAHGSQQSGRKMMTFTRHCVS